MHAVVILTNLGHLKAYRTGKAAEDRGLRLGLINECVFPDARQEKDIERIVEVSGRAFAEGISSYESLPAKEENERRLRKEIISRVKDILEEEEPDYWHFAAPPELFYAVLEGLPAKYRENLLRSAQADLTKIPPGEVMSHLSLYARTAR